MMQHDSTCLELTQRTPVAFLRPLVHPLVHPCRCTC